MSFRTIRWRLILGSLAVTVVPLAGFAWVFTTLLWTFFTTHLETELRERAGVLSDAAAEDFAGGEPVHELVESWGRYSSVRIVIVDRAGIVQAASTPALVGTPIDDDRQPGLRDALRGEDNSTVWRSPNFAYEETMYVNVPARRDGQVVGAVRMAHSLGQVQSEVDGIRSALFGAFLVYVGVLLVAMAWLSRTIAAPVEQLQRDALRLAAGDFERPIPLRPGPLEVEALVRTLNQMTARLAHLEGMRRQYVSDVSHELRTPLASIRAITETLIAHGRSDPELADRYLPRIVTHTNRLARLATQLLDLAQIESGNLLGRRASVPLGPVVEEVVQTVADAALARGVEIVVDVAPDLPEVFADRDRLVQVFLNLVDNAIRHTPEAGTVAVRLRQRGHEVVGEVADTGIGMAPEHLPRLFDRFYRVEQARTARQGGSGLGLAIVKQIVDKHGGRIDVESAPGVGTTFRVMLPAAVRRLTE